MYYICTDTLISYTTSCLELLVAGGSGGGGGLDRRPGAREATAAASYVRADAQMVTTDERPVGSAFAKAACVCVLPPPPPPLECSSQSCSSPLRFLDALGVRLLSSEAEGWLLRVRASALRLLRRA